jgi:hypothetical protein
LEKVQNIPKEGYFDRLSLFAATCEEEKYCEVMGCNRID